MEVEARKLLGRLNLAIPNINVSVRIMSGGQRPVVTVSRAIYFDARIPVMDEQTAASL